MSITLEELIQTAHLAYLTPEDASTLLEPCNTVLKQIDDLKLINVDHMTTLTHPIPATQSLREDNNIAPSALEALSASAPVFADDYYLVPQVIKI
jgi:aspartyl/glutamyl-tRNA(Asn/Gln) amidotransferase C subunit